MTHQAFQEQLAAELMGVLLDFSVPGMYAHVPVTIAYCKHASKKATEERRQCSLVQQE